MPNGTIDYSALIAQIVTQAAGPLEIETPNLGRVMFNRPQDALQAIYLLQMAQAQAAGASATGVFVAGYDRGLSCPSNGGCE